MLVKQHRVRNKNQPQWLSSEILDAMKCRDRHKSLGNHDEYKVWRNKVIKLIQNGKKVIKYLSTIIKAIQVVFISCLRR